MDVEVHLEETVEEGHPELVELPNEVPEFVQQPPTNGEELKVVHGVVEVFG